MIFTTIQKISPAAGEIAYPVRSNRRNIVVIADGHIGTSMVSKQALIFFRFSARFPGRASTLLRRGLRVG